MSKNRLFITLIILLTLSLICGCNSVAEEKELEKQAYEDKAALDAASVFGDINFENAVRAITGTPEGEEIDLASLSGLTELDLTYKGEPADNMGKIVSLDGLKYFPELVSLTIDGNKLDELKGIEACTKLEYLSARNCRLSGVAQLCDIITLKHVDLSNNSVARLEPFRKLVSLEYLNLGYNKITDLSLFSEVGYPSLTVLVLSGNDFPDIAPLSGLTSLKTLRLSADSITDVSPLSAMTELTELYLNNNKITDISPLNKLTRLRILDLATNSISEFTMTACAELEELNMKYNGLRYVDGIALLGSLKKVYLDYNSILDFTPLKGKSYTEITAEGNSVGFTGVQ